MIRPELLAAIRRWQEVIVATGIMALGLWLFSLGGWLLQGLGLALAAFGVAFALVGLRRLRFHQAGSAPGVVEVLEGQISYFGPRGGGFASILEITEIRLIRQGGVRHWRIAQAETAALLIPVGAEGGDLLFDVFATLPGLDMEGVLTALARVDAPDLVVWRRADRSLALI